MCAPAVSTTVVREPVKKEEIAIDRVSVVENQNAFGKLIGLKYPADIRAICTLGVKFGSVVAHWQLFPFLGRWGWALTPFGFVPAFLTCCITHNAMHCAMFKNRSAETTFRTVLSLALGHPVQLYNPTHNHNHHAHTQTEDDHSMTDKVQYQRHWMNGFLYFFHCLPSVFKLENAYIAEQYQRGGTTFTRIVIQMAALYSVWAYLIYLDWVRFLACVYIPGFSGIFAILSISLLQHDGCSVSDVRQGKDLDVNSARNFVDPSLNYFTMNNGYHSVHHMYPNLHWTHYKKLHEEIVKPRINPALEEPSIIGYVWRTFFYPGVLPPHRRNKVQ
uniref:Fatty acid desaturase domain-containing protein n=1 Tax=Pyramimonas obovata TaxID=1411642 RepID=A0A7S0RSJ4_9CHLO|mmetsp:Transcript_5223/g.10646  ORF Transcript_5223/g.10646 Transcript_5223/m.10646 type:complete len:331 (+) Transcript_5223:160-1152(+)